MSVNQGRDLFECQRAQGAQGEDTHAAGQQNHQQDTQRTLHRHDINRGIEYLIECKRDRQCASHPRQFAQHGVEAKPPRAGRKREDQGVTVVHQTPEQWESCEMVPASPGNTK